MTTIVNLIGLGERTALQIIQDFCKRTGLPVPAYLQSNTDAQVIQLLGLLNEELDDLGGRFKWSYLETEATFVATGVENQGKIKDIAPGFKSLIKDTLWSLTKRLQAQGSVSASTTQAIKALGNPAGNTTYRLTRGELHFIPGTNIKAGDLYRFEYNSKYSIIDGDSGVLKQYFEKDQDQSKLPVEILLLGLRWRWKCAKGLAYAENFALYEERVKQAFMDARDAQPLSMQEKASESRGKPGIVVPLGSWNR